MFGDSLGELALQVGRRGLLFDNDIEHESVGSLAARLHRDGGALIDRRVLVDNALDLERADLDAAEVHRVVGTALRLEVAFREARELVAVAAKHFAGRPGRTAFVVHAVVIFVQELLGQANGWRDEETLPGLAFAHDLSFVVENQDLDAESRGRERRR